MSTIDILPALKREDSRPRWDIVTITHTDGESLTEEQVFVNTDGKTIPWGDVKTIEQGDTTTVSNIEQGQTIRLVWTDDDNNMRTLAEYTVE